MEFKKLKKEDKSVVIITIIIVMLIMIMSATSPTETGEMLTFPEWATVNLAIVVFAAIIDVAIIQNQEKKRESEKNEKEAEKIRQDRAQKEMTIAINIKSGAIGISGICQMHQLFENNLFYFNDEFDILYEMAGYEWDGAKYKKVTQTNTREIDMGKTKANGIASVGFGVAGGIGNAKTISDRQGSGETTEKEVEEKGSAIIRMKRIQDERIISFVIECDSEIDKRIRCFNLQESI